jgi:cytochrome c oxidase subunit 2
VPALQGKRDAFTDRQTELWLSADRPGVFEGRCAEFCGHEHALMGIDVVAEAPEQFARWYEAQLRPASPPSDSLAARGLDVFLGNACAGCHSVRGTPASARVAPDLTHLASRRRIAAASYPHTRGWLAGWILDPQTLKPGARMPANPMSGPDLEALLAYLETLL